jgi:hypothetical protein
MNVQDEVLNAARYLREHAGSDFARLPEGSVAKVLNGLSPEARLVFAKQYMAFDHAREQRRDMPFQPKLTDEELYANVNEPLRKTIERMDTEQVTMKLNDRMGTQQENQRIEQETPSNMRDALDSAFDQHSQQE